MNTQANGVYGECKSPLTDDSSHLPPAVQTPRDPRPGRFVRHLDFNHFRTIGMRRSVEEGVVSRFVTVSFLSIPHLVVVQVKASLAVNEASVTV